MATPAAVPFHSVVYRQCASNHTDLSTTLMHSRRRGGRFNPPGEFGAIYVAVERNTALRELARHAAFLGFTLDELLPRTMLCLQLHVGRFLDLADATVCQAWGLIGCDVSQISHDDCWEIARAARDSGFEAIRFRSATGTGLCLAVFIDRMASDSYLDVHSAATITSIGD